MIDGLTARPSPISVSTRSRSGVTSSESIGNFILGDGDRLVDWQSNVQELSGVPTAELERLVDRVLLA